MPTNYEQNLTDWLQRLKDAELAVKVARNQIVFYMGMVIQERSVELPRGDGDEPRS